MKKLSDVILEIHRVLKEQQRIANHGFVASTLQEEETARVVAKALSEVLDSLEKVEMSNNSEKITRLDLRLERIEGKVSELRKAIETGVYDSRDIVIDSILTLEGQLEQIRVDFPKSFNKPA